MARKPTDAELDEAYAIAANVEDDLDYELAYATAANNDGAPFVPPSAYDGPDLGAIPDLTPPPPPESRVVRSDFLEAHFARIAALVSSLELGQVAKMTPEERAEIARLRVALDAMRKQTGAWVDAIDYAFVQAAAATGAKQLPAGEGVVKFPKPRGEFKVAKPHELRRDLENLVAHGLLRAEEVDEAIPQVVTYQPDHRRLSLLAENRGDEVRAAVEGHRTWQQVGQQRPDYGGVKHG